MNTKLINKLALLGAITTTGLQGSENPGDFLNGETQELGTTQEVSHQTVPQSSGTQQTGDQQDKLDTDLMMFVSKYFKNINDFRNLGNTCEQYKKAIKTLKFNPILNPFYIVLVPKYFENINDYINLEMSCNQYRGTMEKFKYNPISFGSDKDQALFPNIETLHLYTNEDIRIFLKENMMQKQFSKEDIEEYIKKNLDLLLNEKIKQIVVWAPIVNLGQKRKGKLSISCFTVEYKRAKLIANDVDKLIDKNGHCIVSPEVVIIDDNCFKSRTNLTSIEIPNSVTSIGKDSFLGCIGLTSIKIPNSVKSINKFAFSVCEKLTSIEIPNSIKSISEACFGYCEQLTSITIPTSVTSISNRCFLYCSNLTSIEIPNSVKSIGEVSFGFCGQLKSIIIPTSVTSIGDKCFFDCTSLTNITLPMRFERQEEQIWLNRSRTEITYTQDNQSAESAETHPEAAQAEEHAETDQENEDGNDLTADAFSTNDEAWE